MVKIFAPNTKYTGVSASVPFAAGVGETDDPYLIAWFKTHGYTVEETDAETVPDVEETDVDADAAPKRSGKRSAGKPEPETECE